MLLLATVFPLQAAAQEDSLLITDDIGSYSTDVSDEEPVSQEINDMFVDTGIEDSQETDELNVKVKGFLDSYHAARTEERAEWMASRTRARGEIMLERGAASMFVSLNATYNGVLKERTGIELREAYLSWAKKGLDLRLGRQIVVWGVADALRVTDCVSPFDYTEFLAQDYDDIRMPVNVLRAKYTWKSFTMEALCCPVADFFNLPVDKDNPWSLTLQSVTMPYEIDLETGKPEKRFRNMEYGGRVCVNLSGIDFSVCGLRTWNKMPAMSVMLSDDRQSLFVKGVYRRMTMLGADCSVPAGRFVFRGETACYLGEAQGADIGMQVKGRDVLNALIGIDWYPGKDWNVSTQYCHKYVSGGLDGLSVMRNSGLATARVSKELMQNMLKLSTFAYVDVTYGGVFNRLSASYSLTDQIEITAGYDYFHADKGQFAMYSKNSEVWMKMKYSF